MARHIEVKILVDTSPLRHALTRTLRRVLFVGLKHSIAEAQRQARGLKTELNRGHGARELALAQTKLEEAEMWLDRSAAASDRSYRLEA
jgi:FAD/FMN-containing dehydrogenase